MGPYDDMGLIQRLHNAVQELVRAKPIQERLYSAYDDHLSALQSEDFPKHRQADFEALEDACTWIPAEEGGEGTIAATLKHMSAEEAEKWTKLIVDLYGELSQGSFD